MNCVVVIFESQKYLLLVLHFDKISCISFVLLVRLEAIHIRDIKELQFHIYAIKNLH